MSLEEYEKTTPVLWPERRHSLVYYLYQLASPEFQQERWIDEKPGTPGVMYGFNLVIHSFFDDTELGENPERTLGGILIDELELLAVRRVVEALDQLLAAVGSKERDVDYVLSAEWPKVIEVATKAYRLMRPRLEAEGDTLLPPQLAIR